MIAHGLGRAPQFVQVAWSSIEQSVERGDFDLGMSGLEDRPELRAAPFRVAFRTSSSAKSSPCAPPTATATARCADLRGKRVATLGATTAYQILLDARDSLGVIPISYDDDVHPYADLVAGRVDAVLLDNIIAERSLRRAGGLRVQPQAGRHRPLRRRVPAREELPHTRFGERDPPRANARRLAGAGVPHLECLGRQPGRVLPAR